MSFQIKMEPKVSVIVPVLNRENLIERCLDSIVNQTVKPFEIIVVDNGSTDSTVNVIERWIESNQEKDISLKLLHQSVKGACMARQKGLEMATGDYVSFFDSDDEMHLDLIEKTINGIINYPDSDIICWKCRINHLDGLKRIPNFMPLKPFEGHLVHAFLMTSNWLAKRSYVLKNGGWSKRIFVWDDFELGLRLLLPNPVITPINEVLAEIYSQEDSITGTDFSSKEGQWETTINELERVAQASNHVSKDKIIKILNYRRAILAAHYYKEGNIKGAEKLMKEALSKASFKNKFFLKFSYYYTRHGLRGAWRLIRSFY